jgi:hypothetical protein
MKILLANNSLEYLGGTETWMITMFNYLSKEHDVDVYVPAHEKNTLIKKGFDESKEYDLGIINHKTCLKELSDFNIGKRIRTSHGVLPGEEEPTIGADIYVAVSEEVQSSLKGKGFDSCVIRNPIDTDHFGYSKPNPTLKKVLWMNNKTPMLSLIEQASKGYEFKIQTGFKNGTSSLMQEADLVITSGRGIYEALSCGKNAVIINWLGCDGLVTEENIIEFRKTNCSGRTFRECWEPERILEELKKYDPERNMRDYILENNEVSKIAEQYLSLREVKDEKN